MTRSGDMVDAFARRASDIALRLLGLPTALIVSLLVLASLLRSGFTVWNWYELSPSLLTDWASPINAFQSNVLLNAIATGWSGVGLDPTSFVWQLTQVAMTVGVFAVISWLILRHTKEESGYLPIAVILSSGLSAVLWREIGRYDALYVLGVMLALLATRSAWAWVGVAIAALSSPEQALVAAILLILLASLPTFRAWLPAGLRLLAGAIGVLIAVQAWFALAGEPFRTRIGIFAQHLAGERIEAATAYDPDQGFIKFTIEKAMVSLSAGPGLVWSILGLTVLLALLIMLTDGGWWRSIYLILIVMVLPVIVSFVFGEDRTRDSALVSIGIITAIAITGSSLLSKLLTRLPGDRRVWLTWLTIIAAIVPMTYFYLEAEEPWRWTKELLISLNNGVPFVGDGSMR